MEKWKLNYSVAWPYFKDHIECGNTLSNIVLKKIDFENGFFFTFLPDNADLNRIYKFQYGGIIPDAFQKLENKGLGDRCSPYQIKKYNTRFNIVEFISNFLKCKSTRNVIADSFNDKTSNPHSFIDNVNASFYMDEVYYILEKNNNFIEIEEVIRRTDVIWHSLILLIDGIDKFPDQLNLDIMHELISKIQLIVVSAYDREGYIYWRKM